MGIKQKPTYVCDFCNKEMDEPFIITHDVPHEGFSTINLIGNDSYYDVGDQHYCEFECLCKDIRKALFPNKKEKL